MLKNCRTCLNYLGIEESVSVNLKVLENTSVLELIRDWASVVVAKPDKLPPVICKSCYETIRCFVEFILIIRKSDVELKKWLCKNDGNKESTDMLREKFRQGVTDGLLDKVVERNNLPGSKQNYIKPLSKSKENSEFKELSNVFINNDLILISKQLTNSRQNSPIIFKCPKCPKTFKKSHQYKMHMTVHTGEKNYLCTICGKYFARSYVLMYHMRVHTGEKKFNCNICSKSFIHPSNLYKHRKIHSGTKNYKCTYCTKLFVQSEALKIHVRRIHTGEKPFLCEICSKSFSSQSALWVHQQDKHKQKESCEICHKQFSSRILKRHVERHKDKEANIKKYICEHCGKNFSSGLNLKLHLLSHNGIKPYASQPVPCPLCKKLYSKRRVKSHICIALKK